VLINQLISEGNTKEALIDTVVARTKMSRAEATQAVEEAQQAARVTIDKTAEATHGECLHREQPTAITRQWFNNQWLPFFAFYREGESLVALPCLGEVDGGVVLTGAY
jgi:hypothetical protein